MRKIKSLVILPAIVIFAVCSAFAPTAFSAEASVNLRDLAAPFLAEEGTERVLKHFRDAAEEAFGDDMPDFSQAVRDAGNEREKQLFELAAIVFEAREYAATALGNPDYSEDEFLNLTGRATKLDAPDREMVADAALFIAEAAERAEELFAIRESLFDQYQAEARRDDIKPGTRLAWSLLRIASGGPQTRVRPEDFRHDEVSAEMSFVHLGVPMRASLDEDDLDETLRLGAYGFTFLADWSLLLQKPAGWIAAIAKDMRAAGVDAATYPEWEVMEGPGSPIAFSMAEDDDAESAGRDGGEGDVAPLTAFYRGKLAEVEVLPEPDDISELTDEFFEAAKALHQGIMNDDRIAQPLRQALHPVLMGTYQPVDPRDYFDSAFCRRLIEADYLETFVKPLPPERRAELARYRAALAKIEAGHDVFVVDLGDGARLAAVVGAEAAFPAEGERKSNDRDQDTGEPTPEYEWRLESDGTTTFYSPLPERSLYSFSLGERYDGPHRVRPKGVPQATEVWHPALGVVAEYRKGDAAARGSAETWQKAVELDARGGRSTQAENLGWNFPMHVLYRDDQGDPVLLATASGVTPSPDFSGMPDQAERRRAEDAWLDGAARVLASPGELGLIFHHFFRYCSDSPLPEMPNLIGSHYGLSDTHQTVYQSLERRWVGRLIGDCDDLAEFFQVLTRRQGKLSHVMSLPAHAASGHAEKLPDGSYEFIVLQTGPVLRFTGATLNEAVEKAYRYFDDEGGESHFSVAAVPLLLRFADEETRTGFVLSARIYGDAEYAESMIRVQEYWHKHVFSAAIREMEEMLKTDRELGSIKELGSLYERVGLYDKSAAMRREELAEAEGDSLATLSCLIDIASLHEQDKNKIAALAALDEAEALFRRVHATDDEMFAKTMSYRLYWAMLMAKLGEPEKAWNLVRLDVEDSKEQYGRVTEPVLRALVTLYDRMAQKRDIGDGLAALAGLAASLGWETPMGRIAGEIDGALARGFFKADDPYNTIISRYNLLGRYAVAREGRAAGLAKLREDGPYPLAAKDQTERGSGVSDEDWQWLRITPRLYLSYGLEMLDPEEYPEFYDPAGAKAMLELVPRAVEKGTGLGADISGAADRIKSAMVLSFVNRDLDGFNRAMAEVRDRDFSSLYDDAALTFGTYSGLVPLEQYAVWIEAFHTFFPGRQHYFKVVYRLLDKEFFDHALMLARATAGFFPDDHLLVDEAEYVDGLLPGLKARKAEREKEAAEAADAA